MHHSRALILDDVIVIDDGISKEVKKQYPRAFFVNGHKPFNFPKNVNLGIEHAGTGIILLNDDAVLETKDGFDKLVEKAESEPDIGILSATSTNVGNRNQWPGQSPELRYDNMVCFTCAYFKKELLDKVGLFDEELVGYGEDDTLYCGRAAQAGFLTAIWEGCRVEHVKGMSSFRDYERETFSQRYAQNRDIREALREKYGLSKEEIFPRRR